MGLSLAIAGKGGTGKTTFSSLLVRALCEAGLKPVLAVDADPNSNLAEALGVRAQVTLSDIREKGSSPEGSPASGMGRGRAIEDRIHREAIVEADGFDLLTMGRPEGPRCYCYVNTLLRKTLDELARGYSAVVLDNEAGLEHLSRRTTDDVDVLVAVMDPTLPALRAVKRILELSRELPVTIGRRVVLVTKSRAGGFTDQLKEEIKSLDVERLPDIPFDAALEEAGALGMDIFSIGSQSPALEAVRNIVKVLTE